MPGRTDGSEVRRCSLEGCENEVPMGRRKYCSERCAQAANSRMSARRQRKRLMALSRERLPQHDYRARRSCLVCDEQFDSEGPWNRICPRCAENQRHRAAMMSGDASQ